MPRRTRPSIQTTAIRPPLQRTAPTAETPTLPLTPIEVDSLVQGASAEDMLAPDASTRPTVENFRPALGSSPLPSALRDADVARPPTEPATPPPSAAAPTRKLSPSAIAGRGTRRLRETLRADAIRPPTRKR